MNKTIQLFIVLGLLLGLGLFWAIPQQAVATNKKTPYSASQAREAAKHGYLTGKRPTDRQAGAQSTQNQRLKAKSKYMQAVLKSKSPISRSQKPCTCPDSKKPATQQAVEQVEHAEQKTLTQPAEYQQTPQQPKAVEEEKIIDIYGY